MCATWCVHSLMMVFECNFVVHSYTHLPKCGDKQRASVNVKYKLNTSNVMYLLAKKKEREKRRSCLYTMCTLMLSRLLLLLLTVDNALSSLSQSVSQSVCLTVSPSHSLRTRSACLCAVIYNSAFLHIFFSKSTTWFSQSALRRVHKTQNPPPPLTTTTTISSVAKQHLHFK